MKCGNTTLGYLNPDTNDCLCPTGHILVENDLVGTKLKTKECLSCPANTTIITADTTIAGIFYKANYYKCQSSPDPNMIYTDNFGRYKCIDDSLVAVGNQHIGPLTCISKTNQYYRTLSTSASNQLVILHYYVIASTQCSYYGGSFDNVYCHILANLCVLQSYDYSSISCQAFQNIFNARNSSVNPSVSSWGYNLPWIFYESLSSTSLSSDVVCEDTGFHTSVNLNSDQLKFVVTEYSLNGTFLGKFSLH